MSGLTGGLTSIDKLEMEILLECGTDEEKKMATRLLPIIEYTHWLLVTLLISNAFALEALPLFLNQIVPAYVAVILSVTAVLTFAEIIPNAICMGHYQLAIAYHSVYPVWFLMYLTGIISWPVAKLLDCCMGDHGGYKRYNNDELKAIVKIHAEEAM